jgi:hypothetical protein
MSEEIWLVTFMDYDLGYFDHEMLGRTFFTFVRRWQDEGWTIGRKGCNT